VASSAAGDEHEITAINVTPLVDIMLVLLVIFMVTATYVVKEAIPIELPRAAAGSETPARTLAIVVDRNGRAYLDGVEVDEGALLREVARAPERREDLQVIIGADRDARHGAVIRILDLLKGEGISKFAIQVERDAHP
jgi:biopolymer transport protein TolR